MLQRFSSLYFFNFPIITTPFATKYRLLAVLNASVNEIEDLSEATVEEYGYKRVARLRRGPGIPLFAPGTEVTTDQVQALYQAPRPVGQRASVDGQLKELFGSHDQGPLEGARA